MTARLTSAMLVSSLMRLVTNAGGNAAVVAKGDPGAGGIILICTERGVFMSLQERLLGMEGQYFWQPVGPGTTHPAADIDAYLDRRRFSDGDIWVIELDIANAERFAAETISTI
ncbi:MAG: hypothetical protein JWO15_516 [Sphingomonadales bacterium]|nr:hypothetical protein [Sphingomonadales bacterium]